MVPHSAVSVSPAWRPTHAPQRMVASDDDAPLVVHPHSVATPTPRMLLKLRMMLSAPRWMYAVRKSNARLAECGESDNNRKQSTTASRPRDAGACATKR